MQRLLLWGATGQAKVLAELGASLGFQVVALIDNNPGVQSPFEGVPIFHGLDGFDRCLAEIGVEGLAGAAAIGGWRGGDRLEILDLMADRGLATPSLVHIAAWVAHNAVVEDGAQVLAGAHIAAETVISRAAIVNTSASVDHECHIGPGAHVASGAVLAGAIEVGRDAFIGPGAVVVARVRIGDSAIVGAGSVITKDVPAGAVVYGSPGRVVRSATAQRSGSADGARKR
jgi:sugar O-acyltransferase (sialic acid O-acetyltransferase NeuD family)